MNVSGARYEAEHGPGMGQRVGLGMGQGRGWAWAGYGAEQRPDIRLDMGLRMGLMI